MTDYLVAFASRLAVMLPAILMVAALAWWGLRRLGLVTPDAPFNPADMRTWPLRFALADALLFAVVFAAVLAALADSTWSAGIAAAVAAVVATGIAPQLSARMRR